MRVRAAWAILIGTFFLVLAALIIGNIIEHPTASDATGIIDVIAAVLGGFGMIYGCVWAGNVLINYEHDNNEYKFDSNIVEYFNPQTLQHQEKPNNWTTCKDYHNKYFEGME